MWFDHLHIDYTAGDADLPDSTPLRPIDDPLSKLDLSVVNDTYEPTVDTEKIFFMAGSRDIPFLTGGTRSSRGNYILQGESNSRSTRYFHLFDAAVAKTTVIGKRAAMMTGLGQYTAGTSAIDIISGANDQLMPSYPPDAGIKEIGISGTGQLVGATFTKPQSFNFSGEFTKTDGATVGQTTESLRTSVVTRVAYQNDWKADSTDTLGYYILTNSDDNPLIRLANDSDRYWNTTAITGSIWNDNTASLAADNAHSAFPDDYYNISVTAKDVTGNSTTSVKKVVLDNWAQMLTATTDPNQSGPPQGADPRGRFVLFSGEQWTAGVNIPISLVKATINAGGLNAGDTISSKGILLGSAKTDADGKFNSVRLWVPYWDTGGSAPEFVADYHNGDDIYQPQLDAVTELQVVEARMAPARFVAFGGLPGPDGQKTDTPVIVVTAPEPPELSTPVTAADLAPVPAPATPHAVSALPVTAAIDDPDVGLLPDLARLP